jgi:hypothetical protein
MTKYYVCYKQIVRLLFYIFKTKILSNNSLYKKIVFTFTSHQNIFNVHYKSRFL